MKKVQIRVSGFVMVIVLLLSMLAACSSNEGGNKQTNAPATTTGNKEGAEKPDVTEETSKPVGTVKIVLPGDQPKDMAGVQKAMEEKLKADGLNIKLQFTYFPWDQYSNKLNLIAASGEDYDMAWTHVSWLSQITAKNVIIPLNDLLDEQGMQLKESIPLLIS